MEKVSVVITTYNRFNFLVETINSVLNQTYQNIEIIIIDDGSSDNNIRTYCESIPNVKYFYITNTGSPSKARNLGLKYANGKYIAFLDDDDLWKPYKIEIQVKVLENNPDYGLVHSYCEVIDENSNTTGEVIGRSIKKKEKHGDVKFRMFASWTLMMPTPLVRKDLIDLVGFFNCEMPHAGEDCEFWTRCSFFTKFFYLDKPTAYYRRHSGNVSANNKFYIDLPKHLFSILKSNSIQSMLSVYEFRILRNKALISQVKYINIDLCWTFSNLFSIHTLWFTKIGILKILIKKTSSLFISKFYNTQKT